MKEQLAILIVEDSEDDALLLLRELGHAGFPHVEHTRVDTEAGLAAALDSQRWDAIISDYVMPHFSGLEALKMTRARGLDVPFIIVSGKIGEDVAVEAMRAGANDYVLKSSLARLAPAIEREIGEAHTRQCRLDAEAELGFYREHLEELVTLKTAELRIANLAIQRASAAKSDFLSSMSHEFRTPLNSILGFTDIMQRGLAGPLTDEQAKQMSMVHSAAEELLSLVNDLLDLAKIEAGKTEVALERIHLSECVARIVQLMGPLFAERGLEFSVDAARTPEVIVSDSAKLQQVIVNLLGNAAKFTEAGSVRLVVRSEGDRVCFDVVDTGVGIDSGDIGHVFERFRQAGTVVAVGPRGTGLGLAISKELVGLLGGEISVKSTLGVGSTFTVCVPMEPEPSLS